MKIDMHIHSKYSFDCSNELDDIINMAIKNKISVISICDHNEYEGYLKIKNNGKVEVISGIEIDCFFDDKIIHLLGYGMDFNDVAFKNIRDNYINELNRIAYDRIKIIEDKYNCKLDIEKIKSYGRNGFFTNVEIEKVLLEDIEHPGLEVYQTGNKADNPIANFYWDNLSIGKWGYIALNIPDYKEVINLIHRNKGIVILAHPYINIKQDENLIKKLIAAKIDGIEVYSSYHNEENIKFYEDICNKYGLLKTFGSDYHGKTKPNIKLGETLYKGDCHHIYKAIKDKLEEYHQ